MMALNGTYKISKENLVLVVMANTDRKHSHHPISFMLTTDETEESYRFILETT